MPPNDHPDFDMPAGVLTAAAAVCKTLENSFAEPSPVNQMLAAFAYKSV
jgi:hypothetical protein